MEGIPVENNPNQGEGVNESIGEMSTLENDQMEQMAENDTLSDFTTIIGL